MTTSVSIYDFKDAFRSIRPNNFSSEGLDTLFEYLEQYEEDTDTEMELDVIAICCDFNESTIAEALSYYDLETIEELEDSTLVMYVDDQPKDFDLSIDGDKLIIYQNF
tara:strand:+ start:363 stop:686 length:324 start_codon:yes stop_codon:yes gene_type:complete